MRHVAVIVGHTRVAPGVQNGRSLVTEFAFNGPIARWLVRMLDDAGVPVAWYSRPEPNDIAGLVRELNRHDLVCIVELHANGHWTEPSGTEMWHWHTSAAGRRLAEKLQLETLAVMGLRDRGLRPTRQGDRGWYVLGRTRAPAVIVEPFFLTTDSDLARGIDRRFHLAAAYAAAIRDYVGAL